MSAPNSQITARLGPTGRFIGHFFEMCAAMCVGMGVLDLVYIGIAASAGHGDPFRDLPELSVLVVMVNMTVPMAAWMRVRGMSWQPTLEMSAAMVLEALVVLVLAEAGAIAKDNLVLAWQHPLMMPAMLAAMLYHPHYYTHRMGTLRTLLPGRHHRVAPNP